MEETSNAAPASAENQVTPEAQKQPSTRKREAPLAPKAPASSPGANLSPPSVKPVIRNRHDMAFRHDVFRSSNANCLRNVSYKALEPDLQKIQHAHVYHSHSNDGRKLTRTGAACGHWHDVRHYVDPATGEIKAEVGPAMCEVTYMSKSGKTFNRVEQVSFRKEIQTGENQGEEEVIVDDHTHTMDYLGSEELSPSQIQNSLKAQQAEAAAMGVVVGGVKDNTPAPMNASDGADIR